MVAGEWLELFTSNHCGFSPRIHTALLSPTYDFWRWGLEGADEVQGHQQAHGGTAPQAGGQAAQWRAERADARVRGLLADR